MARDAQVRRKAGGGAIDLIGPELVPVKGGHRPQQGECRIRGDCIVGERGIRGQADESELRQGAGRPVRRPFPFEPFVDEVVVNV